jgi:D-3-phosphoglycerate dehydrogenase
MRNLKNYLSSVSQGKWTPTLHPNVNRISGKIMTVIGYGKIGQKVVERALAFGFHIRVYDPFYKGEFPSGVSSHKDISEAVKDSDVVTVHVPLTKSTENIVDKKIINLMSQDSLLVNVARGGLIKLEDAINALDENKLSWLALDVVDNEPPEKNDILRNHQKVILTPHVAYFSKQSVQESKRICVDNIILGLNNKQVIGPIVQTQ